jgi:signal transduction histidine kinase
MTLLRKFGVLVAVLAMIVALNLGSAAWAISVLQRESFTYLNSISSVLGGLNRIKRDISDLAALLPVSRREDERPWAGFDPPSQVSPALEFQRLAAAIRGDLDYLEETGSFQARAGISTTLNIRHRIEQSLSLAQRWVEGADEEAAAEARRQMFVLHELIERNESKILGDAERAVQHSRDVRRDVIAVVGVALAITVCVGVLTLALVRRWVLRPVSELRTAAARIGSGDFSHRVSFSGRDELAMLSSEVNHMASMISAMQEERIERERLAAIGEMVRRLAHNLRNPLAGIRSLAELTKGELDPAHSAQENQDRIISTVDRFEGWLAEMLSATTPLKVMPECNPVRKWLEGVAEPLDPMAASRGIRIVVEHERAPELAAFDARHLEQALVGIIINAIQVSSPGDTVTISASEHAPTWSIRIADEGPGVPPELREKVFRPYFTTRREGTGIGLAVARQVVEQHGGQIAVEPGGSGRGGGGAAFVLTLPLRAAGERKAELASNGQSGDRGGQDPDDRGRSEPPVLDPADAQARRP